MLNYLRKDTVPLKCKLTLYTQSSWESRIENWVENQDSILHTQFSILHTQFSQDSSKQNILDLSFEKMINSSKKGQ